jgi:hypothetical protein
VEGGQHRDDFKTSGYSEERHNLLQICRFETGWSGDTLVYQCGNGTFTWSQVLPLDFSFDYLLYVVRSHTRSLQERCMRCHAIKARVLAGDECRHKLSDGAGQSSSPTDIIIASGNIFDELWAVRKALHDLHHHRWFKDRFPQLRHLVIGLSQFRTRGM